MSSLAFGVGHRMAAAIATAPRQQQQSILSMALRHYRGMGIVTVAAATAGRTVNPARGNAFSTLKSRVANLQACRRINQYRSTLLAPSPSCPFATNNGGGSGNSDVPGWGSCLPLWAGLGLTCYAYGSLRLWYFCKQDQIHDMSRTAHERIENIKQHVDDIQSDVKLNIDRTRERIENVKSKAKERIQRLDGTAQELLENVKSASDDLSDGAQETINRFQKLQQEVKERLDQSAILHVGNEGSGSSSSNEIMSHGENHHHHVKNKGNPPMTASATVSKC